MTPDARRVARRKRCATRDRMQRVRASLGARVAARSVMRLSRLAPLLVLAACGPETTSFRPTDQGDGGERSGPPAASYPVRLDGRDVASVHVWSNGGYIGSSDEPMTHVGFEIRNTSARGLVFDGDALALIGLDRYGAMLPLARFTTVTPLGPAQVPIAPGTTTTLDAYFQLPVRPRAIDAMRVRWSLQIGDRRLDQTTSFVRDDGYPVAEPPVRPAS